MNTNTKQTQTHPLKLSDLLSSSWGPHLLVARRATYTGGWPEVAVLMICKRAAITGRLQSVTTQILEIAQQGGEHVKELT